MRYIWVLLVLLLALVVLLWIMARSSRQRTEWDGRDEGALRMRADEDAAAARLRQLTGTGPSAPAPAAPMLAEPMSTQPPQPEPATSAAREPVREVPQPGARGFAEVDYHTDVPSADAAAADTAEPYAVPAAAESASESASTVEGDSDGGSEGGSDGAAAEWDTSDDGLNEAVPPPDPWGPEPGAMPESEVAEYAIEEAAPAPTPSVAVAVEPASAPGSVSDVEPNPVPLPEPGPKPIPEPGPVPIPEPGPKPIPEPGPVPMPEPGPAPVPEPGPVPLPETAVSPDAMPAAESAADSAAVPETGRQPDESPVFVLEARPEELEPEGEPMALVEPQPTASAEPATDESPSAEIEPVEPASSERPEGGGHVRISSLEEVRDGGYGVGSAAPVPDGAQPLGHPVKGNLGSMTFLEPGSRAYDRATAEVWFIDAETAEYFGFTRAGG